MLVIRKSIAGGSLTEDRYPVVKVKRVRHDCASAPKGAVEFISVGGTRVIDIRDIVSAR